MTVTSKVTVNCYYTLNGAGVSSMQGKWEELFGVEEEVREEKPKKPARKRSTRKKAISGKRTTSKKPREKKKID